MAHSRNSSDQLSSKRVTCMRMIEIAMCNGSVKNICVVLLKYLVSEGKTGKRREVLCPLDSHEEETRTDFVIALRAEACLLLLSLKCSQVVLLNAFRFRRRLVVPKSGDD